VVKYRHGGEDVNYKPKEFAKILNVSVKTLQRWDKAGILKAYRTLTDRRYYTEDHLEKTQRRKE